MPDHPRPAVKVALSLIGVAAVLVPLILILTNFQPLGFLYEREKSNQQSTNNTNPPPIATKSGTPLLSETDFAAVQKNGESLIIDLRPQAQERAGVLVLTPPELENLLRENDQTKLKTLLKSNRLVLVTTDLIQAHNLTRSLQQKGFLVSIFLTHE